MKTIAEINAELREYLQLAGDDVVITHDYAAWENAANAILITETRLDYERDRDLDMGIHRYLTATAQLIGRDTDTVNDMIDALTEAEYTGDIVHLPMITSVVYGADGENIHSARVEIQSEIWDYGE